MIEWFDIQIKFFDLKSVFAIIVIVMNEFVFCCLHHFRLGISIIHSILSHGHFPLEIKFVPFNIFGTCATLLLLGIFIIMLIEVQIIFYIASTKYSGKASNEFTIFQGFE